MPATSPPNDPRHSSDLTSSRQPGTPPTPQFISLDSGRSRTEHLAIRIIRILRQITPNLLIAWADFIALLASGQAAIAIRHLMNPLHYGINFPPILPAYTALMLFGYFAVGLYPSIRRSGPDELRRLTLTTTALTFIIIVMTYISRGGFDVNTAMFIVAWGIALFAVPLGRAVVRSLFAHRNWWGPKAIILSTDRTHADKILRNLRSRPRIGLRASAILLMGAQPEMSTDLGLPLLHGTDSTLAHARENGINYAIITLSDLNDPGSLALIRRYETCFKHWIIVPYTTQSYSLWVRTRDLNGMLGLELTHHLLSRKDRLIKRLLDLVLTLIGAVCALPLGLIIAVAIKLDSPGPILYSQHRLGRNGKVFRVYKFRSMVFNACEILQNYFLQHPELRTEWEHTQKLKRDPRISRVGRFLRKTSLDELPQLLNVLRGEMSLVGPRPIVEAEIPHYGEVWELYQRVRPGITGQWQVSGRNDTTYAERTAMDTYYIRNWSIWLDIYLLARTASSALRGDGAY